MSRTANSRTLSWVAFTVLGALVIVAPAWALWEALPGSGSNALWRVAGQVSGVAGLAWPLTVALPVPAGY